MVSIKPEVRLHVQVRAMQFLDGKFSPRISVIRESFSQWKFIPFELKEQKEFDNKKGAIAFGKRSAAKELQEKYPQAKIRIQE